LMQATQATAYPPYITVTNEIGFPSHLLWKFQPLHARQEYLDSLYQKRLDVI
jgi:hypothetical protein